MYSTLLANTVAFCATLGATPCTSTRRPREHRRPMDGLGLGGAILITASSRIHAPEGHGATRRKRQLERGNKQLESVSSARHSEKDRLDYSREPVFLGTPCGTDEHPREPRLFLW